MESRYAPGMRGFAAFGGHVGGPWGHVGHCLSVYDHVWQDLKVRLMPRSTATVGWQVWGIPIPLLLGCSRVWQEDLF